MKNLSPILSFCVIASPAFAEITFTDGKWETTFDCPDWEDHVSGSISNCDGLGGVGGETNSGNNTQITSSANYSSGDGSKGIRFFVDAGDDILSAPIYAQFPSAEDEIWVRFYIRFETGLTWSGGEPGYVKLFYNRTYQPGEINDGADPSAIPGLASGALSLTAQAGDTRSYRSSTYRWSDLNDDNWHCVEFYTKMNSSYTASDGIGRMWLDGNLAIDETGIQWVVSNDSHMDGWKYLLFKHNQAYVTSGEKYVDYDDIAVYNTTPPNTDASGNPYIGPLGSTLPDLSPPVISITSPSSSTIACE